MPDKKELHLDGIRYVFDRGTWVDAQTSMVPPLAIIHKLNGLVLEQEMRKAQRRHNDKSKNGESEN